MKILVAMSGGVDSSVVAHLLKEQGHELIGMMMKLWVDPLAPEDKRILPKKCCSLEHIQRARQVCDDLEIPFYVVNLENEFKEQVIDDYLEKYQAGQTPNPCIECNRTIKFGALLDKVKELECEALATGHYARVEEADGSYHLKQAIDDAKDQSYYLYNLSQAKLSQVIFPLGGKTKAEVFKLAKKYGVEIPEWYRESQDLCFYPEAEPDEFLKRHLKMEPGNIVTEAGEVVGEHQGLPLYTIGQRKGLGIGGLKIPLHVKAKNVKENELVVVPDGDDCHSECKFKNLHWISKPPDQSEGLNVRVSSLGAKYQGHFADLKKTGGTWIFNQPVRGLAPGQSIVFYDQDEILGGAIIT